MSNSTAGMNNRWPPQIKYIVGNEACERFSFYGMKGILVGYMTATLLKGGLNMSPDKATSIFHLFVFANYFTPLIGAWLSDKIFGRYNTILWVSLFYCAGHGVLAFGDMVQTADQKFALLCVGLTLIAFGAGGIKPCVSAFMGDQFKSDQNHLLQKAYGAFYWSINFGSFFSFIVIPQIRDKYGYGWAFGVPGILMAVATIIFWLGRRHYVRSEPTGDQRWLQKILTSVAIALGVSCVWIILSKIQLIGSAAVEMLGAWGPWVKLVVELMLLILSIGLCLSAIIVLSVYTVRLHRRIDRNSEKCEASPFVVWWYGLTSPVMGKTGGLWDSASKRFAPKSFDNGVSMARILSIFVLIPPFWALFDQSHSTWVLQGNKMNVVELTGIWKTSFGWFFGSHINAENMQSTNPLLVMMLVPLMTLMVYPALGKFVTPLRRMGLGMFFAAASYVIVAWLQQRIDDGEKISVAWQILPYIFLTTGEVLISATGLEFAFTQAAPAMKSTIMSFWLLTVAVGNALVSIITSVLSSEAGGHSAAVSPGRFLMYAGLTCVVGVLFAVVASRYKYRDANAAA